MIEFQKVSKIYQKRRVVDNLSFSINSPSIVGFLGNNGAGKTTTMRLLTGYIHPTEGSISVLGKNIQKDPLLVKKSLGYLAETNPLYNTMRVSEYLRFRAELKGLSPSEKRLALDRVLENCDISDIRNTIIKQLSKGYRQRVGLADALIHDPPILLLDEPTSALDPEQKIKTRELIKKLSKDRLIFFSSHILSEVEDICDEVIIIKHGKILAQGSWFDLKKNATETHSLLCSIAPAKDSSECVVESLEKLEGVKKVSVLQQSLWVFEIFYDHNRFQKKALLQLILENSWELLEFKDNSTSLESFFLKITQKDTVLDNTEV